MAGPAKRYPHILKVRLGQDEYAYVSDLARIMGESRAEVLRAMVRSALVESMHNREVLAR